MKYNNKTITKRYLSVFENKTKIINNFVKTSMDRPRMSPRNGQEICLMTIDYVKICFNLDSLAQFYTGVYKVPHFPLPGGGGGSL